jgi:3-deoxy-7-phosphoheptulonate synthase
VDEGADRVADVADIIQISAGTCRVFAPQARRQAAETDSAQAGTGRNNPGAAALCQYILAEGNPNVILCERGVRGFDPATRNLFDLSAIPVVHGLSHLPIIADPSHGTGHREMVIPMARAAVAAGADGLLIEVHPNPDRALSDGAQSLYPEQFARLMKETRIIAEAIGRRIAVAGGVRV